MTVTNLSNFKSINLNISGPGSFSVVDNTFTSYGAGLDAFPTNLVPLNLPPVAFTHGQTVIQFDNLGNISSISFTSTAQNLCQLVE